MTIYKMIYTGEKFHGAIGLDPRHWRQQTAPYVVLKDGIPPSQAENPSVTLTSDLTAEDLKWLKKRDLTTMDKPVIQPSESE